MINKTAVMISAAFLAISLPSSLAAYAMSMADLTAEQTETVEDQTEAFSQEDPEMHALIDEIRDDLAKGNMDLYKVSRLSDGREVTVSLLMNAGEGDLNSPDDAICYAVRRKREYTDSDVISVVVPVYAGETRDSKFEHVLLGDFYEYDFRREKDTLVFENVYRSTGLVWYTIIRAETPGGITQCILISTDLEEGPDADSRLEEWCSKAGISKEEYACAGTKEEIKNTLIQKLSEAAKKWPQITLVRLDDGEELPL